MGLMFQRMHEEQQQQKLNQQQLANASEQPKILIVNEPIAEEDYEGTNTNQEATYPIVNNEPNHIGNEEDEYTFESEMLQPGEE